LWDGNGSKVRAFEFFGNLPVRVAVNQDGTRIVGTDFAGRVAVWNSADGKRLGELDPNPLRLADQIAEAKQCLNQIEAKQGVVEPATPVKLSKNELDSLTTARANLNRLQALQVLSYVYDIRENLAATRKTSMDHAALDLEQARVDRLLNYYHDLLSSTTKLERRSD
jgi:hypothetical protein